MFIFQKSLKQQNKQINKNLRQLLECTLRAFESITEFLHSFISKVIVRQVQLVNDALWHEHSRERFAALMSEAAVTQTETEQKSSLKWKDMQKMIYVL